MQICKDIPYTHSASKILNNILSQVIPLSVKIDIMEGNIPPLQHIDEHFLHSHEMHPFGEFLTEDPPYV
jgi:hypothetical protein